MNIRESRMFYFAYMRNELPGSNAVTPQIFNREKYEFLYCTHKVSMTSIEFHFERCFEC